MGPGNEEEARRWRGQAVGYSEEAGGGGEALLGGEREREVADAERVRGVVGRVAPGHLPLHQLLRAPHRHGLLRRRRHFDLRSLGSEFGLERSKENKAGRSGSFGRASQLTRRDSQRAARRPSDHESKALALHGEWSSKGVDVWWTEEEITSSQRENDAEGEFPIGACPESDEKKKFWMSVSPFSDGCVCVLRPLERVYIKKSTCAIQSILRTREQCQLAKVPFILGHKLSGSSHSLTESAKSKNSW